MLEHSVGIHLTSLSVQSFGALLVMLASRMVAVLETQLAAVLLWAVYGCCRQCDWLYGLYLGMSAGL